MKATRFFVCAAFIGLILLVAGCGGKSSSATGPSVAVGPDIKVNIDSISFFNNGQELGVLYIEGSCDGTDNQGKNVTSLDSSGSILRPRGDCDANVPFQLEGIKISSNAVNVFIAIGPSAKGLKTVSIPLDSPGKGIFDRYNMPGKSGLFSQIPTIFYPAVGNVGFVRSGGRVAWGEISGPYGKIRRTYLEGDCAEILFYNHPDTNNIERGFPVGGGGFILPIGKTLRCVEEIRIDQP
jgi:hypothetical protein